MQDNNDNQNDNATETAKKPDDAGTVEVNARFKIFDPNTQEVFVEDRG